MDWLDRINPQVRTAWAGTWRTGTVEPGRVLTDHELVLCSRGSCRVELSGGSRTLEAPGFLIIPPGCEHLTRVVAGPATRLCIHFDWTWTGRPQPARPIRFCPERPAADELRPAPDVVPAGVLGGALPRGSPALELAQRLVVRWRGGERRAVRAGLLELLIALLAAERPEPDDDRATALALRVKARLDAGGLDDRRLRPELAALGHSYEHLCRAFTRTFGIPPLRYLTLARVARAQEMLAEPGATVAGVAGRLGYDDPAYFARVFRRIAGRPPSLAR